MNMNKIEELQVEIDNLQKELDELKKQENNGMWIPKRGERYWYIDGCGEVFYTINKFMPKDEKRFLVGNVFKTKEEAEFAVEKLKVLAELKVFAESKDRKWDGENRHWEIGYWSDRGLVNVDWFTCKSGGIYFESKEKARQAIDAVGVDRIKKYYLEVE